ncbi:MAG: TolC family protein, partial [Flavobacteriaceae bacterium]|nr:TolC family protein [Flavobacteriaceae bacterium]
MKRYIYIVALLVISIKTQSQNLLTKDDAIKIALEQNYDIQVTQKNVEIAENNASIYNSGFLPTASVNSGAGYANSSNKLEAQDGTTIEVKDAVTFNYNASVGINYVLFDGLNRKYNYSKLKEIYNLSELQARQVIENTILNLYFTYYEVARLTENEKNQKATLEISKRRLLRSTYAVEFGQATKLDALNAEVDTHNDSINYLDSKRQLINAKRNLNVALGREISIIDFEIETDVEYILGLDVNSLLESSLSNNIILLQVNKGLELSNFDIAIGKSGWMPTISASGSYGWNEVVNDNP